MSTATEQTAITKPFSPYQDQRFTRREHSEPHYYVSGDKTKGAGFGDDKRFGFVEEDPAKRFGNLEKMDEVYLLIDRLFDGTQEATLESINKVIDEANAVHKENNFPHVTWDDIKKYTSSLPFFNENLPALVPDEAANFWKDNTAIVEELGYDGLWLVSDDLGGITVQVPMRSEQIIHAKTGREMTDPNTNYDAGPALAPQRPQPEAGQGMNI